MDRDDVLGGIFTLAVALALGETLCRFRDRNLSKTRFLRERWTLEKSWERFDALSGWEPAPGFRSEGIEIDRCGFRGPELNDENAVRIVFLGDSITFGPPGEEYPFPAVVRMELDRLKPAQPVEVINAGVTGHSSANMRFRVRRIMDLNPSLVVVFAGWNDMFNDDIARYADHRVPASSFWHIAGHRNVRSCLLEAILEAGARKQRKPEPVSYRPQEFVPFNFEYNLREIIRTVSSRSRAALMTLPKLVPDDVSRVSASMAGKITLPAYLGEGELADFIAVYRAYGRPWNAR